MGTGDDAPGVGEPRSLTDLAVLRAVYRTGHMAYGTPALLVRRKCEGDARSATAAHLRTWMSRIDDPVSEDVAEPTSYGLQRAGDESEVEQPQ